MREILFKAKRKDNGEWVEGFYHYTRWIYPQTGELAEVKYYILPINSQDAYEIDIKTICQYTGLIDKNGNKIWENDIVECKGNDRHFRSQIEWDEVYCGFIFQDTRTSAVGLDALSKGGCYRDFEVVGNIFDIHKLEGGEC